MAKTRDDGEGRRLSDEEHPDEGPSTFLHHGHGQHFFLGVNNTGGLA